MNKTFFSCFFALFVNGILFFPALWGAQVAPIPVETTESNAVATDLDEADISDENIEDFLADELLNESTDAPLQDEEKNLVDDTADDKNAELLVDDAIEPDLEEDIDDLPEESSANDLDIDESFDDTKLNAELDANASEEAPSSSEDFENENIDNLFGDDGELDIDALLSDDFSPDDDLLDENQEREAGSYSPTKGEYKIPIQPFGMVTFAPSPQTVAAGNLVPKTHHIIAEADAQKSKSFSLGIMYFEGVNAWINENGNLCITGTGRCGGKDFTFKLVSHTPAVPATQDDEKGLESETTYELTFADKVHFKVRQDQDEWVQNAQLTMLGNDGELTASKTIKLSSTTVEDARITFGITPEDREVSTELGTLKLTELFKSESEGDESKKISGITMEDVVMSAPNPFMPEIIEQDMSATGFAKLSNIKLFGQTTLSDGDATMTLTPDTFGFECQGEDPIKFYDEVTFENPLTEIMLQKGDRPELTIAGTLDIKTAAFKTRAPVRGEIRDDGVELRGKVQEKIDAGPIKLANPELVFYTTDGTGGLSDEMQDRAQRSMKSSGGGGKMGKIELTNRMSFFGLKTNLIVRLTNSGEAIPTKRGKAKKWVKQIVGEFPDLKKMNPLTVVPGLKEIPGLEAFDIDMPGLGIDNTGSFMIKGVSQMMGAACNVTVNTGKALGVQAVSQEAWSVGSAVSELKGSPLDFTFDQVSIGYQKGKRFDPNTNMMLERGMNIFGSVDMTQGVFKPIRKILGGALPKKLIASLILNPNPRHCKAILTIPLDVKLSSKASMHSIMLEISGEPSVALMLVLKFIPSKKDPPLLFTARIEFELIGVALSGTMTGFWHHPFGIKGFHIGNLAVEIKFPYAAPPVPIAIGFAGTMQIAKELAEVAVKVGMDDNIVMAKIPYFPLYWTPELMRQAGLDLGPLDFIKAFDIAFHDIIFKFAPTGGQIGMLFFDPGLSAEGKLTIKIPWIINTVVHAGFNLDMMKGFKLFATLPNTDIGPLKLSGKGKDGKKGTKDDGPVFWAELSMGTQRVYLNANAELLGSFGEIEAELKPFGLKFEMYLKLLNIIKAYVEGETYRNKESIGFRVKGYSDIGSGKMKLLGDISTRGLAIAGSLDHAYIGDIIGQPAVKVGFSNIELYMRAQV